MDSHDIPLLAQHGVRIEVLIFTWKMQSEAEEVIAGYARQQQKTRKRPFTSSSNSIINKAQELYVPRSAT